MQFYEQLIGGFDLQWAIANGWSVPPVCKLSRVDGLDLSMVKIVGGDFHQQQLQAELNKEANLHRLCMIVAEEMEGQTVLFTGGVFQMHGATQYLNDNYGIKAVEVWGKQPEEERRESLRQFKSGEVPVLVNCQVVAVGFDFPPTATLVLGRPTRSRSFWLQCVGRATRPLAGVVDFAGSTAESRIAAIAASKKKHFKIVDCTTGTLDHSLITSVDMFVQADDEVKREIKDRAVAKPLTAEEMAELAAQATAKIASAKAIEELRRNTHGRGQGRVSGEQVDLASKDAHAVGTYKNPINGKFAGKKMSELPDYYVAWGSRELKGWPRSLFNKEKERRRERQTA